MKQIATCAPVVAFAYNRADKIIRCLEALEQNPECFQTDLIIYGDGAKSEKGLSLVEETRKTIKEYKNRSKFQSVEVIEAPQNKGLARSILEGVTTVLNQYGKAIIVEDDLIVSKDFLRYMNGALSFYEKDTRIGAISGYTYPVEGLKNYQQDTYLLRKGDCWGWATWEDRWKNAEWSAVDFEAYFRDKALRKRLEQTENGWDLLMLLQSQGKISSWAIRWVLYLLQNDLCTVYPKSSLVTNSGFDGSGTHSNQSEENHFFTQLVEHPQEFVYTKDAVREQLAYEAAVFPRKGINAGCKYWMKRCYVKIYDVKRLLRR